MTIPSRFPSGDKHLPDCAQRRGFESCDCPGNECMREWRETQATAPPPGLAEAARALVDALDGWSQWLPEYVAAANETLRAVLEVEPQMPLSEACLRGGCQYGPSSGHAPSPLSEADAGRLASVREQRDRELTEPYYQKVRHFAWIDMDLVLRLLDSAYARIAELERERDALQAKLADECMEHSLLKGLLSRPEIDDFWDGIVTEAAHQRQRWGDAHDRSKSAENWFWLVGYLSGKALRAAIEGDKSKAKHHTISTAAALFQWHQAIKADETECGIGRDEDIDPEVGHLGTEPALRAALGAK